MKLLPTYSREHCPIELFETEDHTLTIRSKYGRQTHHLYEIGSELAPTKTWAEFGVGCGNSAELLCDLLKEEGNLFLFDGWEGIPTEWVLGPDMTSRKGAWAFRESKVKRRFEILKTKPAIEWLDGWYEDTLPYEFPEQLGLVNIDCDVYTSTRDVLYGCDEWIGDGTVLVFDEILGYQNYQDHEYRAVKEWMCDTDKTIEWIGKEKFAAVGVVKCR